MTLVLKTGEQIDIEYCPERPSPVTSNHDNPDFYDDGDPEVFEIEAVRSVGDEDITAIINYMNCMDAFKETAYMIMQKPEKYGASIL
jgi:hypothetical protein